MHLVPHSPHHSMAIHPRAAPPALAPPHLRITQPSNLGRAREGLPIICSRLIASAFPHQRGGDGRRRDSGPTTQSCTPNARRRTQQNVPRHAVRTHQHLHASTRCLPTAPLLRAGADVRPVRGGPESSGGSASRLQLSTCKEGPHAPGEALTLSPQGAWRRRGGSRGGTRARRACRRHRPPAATRAARGRPTTAGRAGGGR